jgi:post-segregation antitoxin (ccd killing protein)
VTGFVASYLRNRDDPVGAAERARRWMSENAAAIGAYNAFVEQHGVVGDDFRSW